MPRGVRAGAVRVYMCVLLRLIQDEWEIRKALPVQTCGKAMTVSMASHAQQFCAAPPYGFPRGVPVTAYLGLTESLNAQQSVPPHRMVTHAMCLSLA